MTDRDTSTESIKDSSNLTDSSDFFGFASMGELLRNARHDSATQNLAMTIPRSFTQTSRIFKDSHAKNEIKRL